jgi:carbohydrate kinase (thermoresistant glucokinase family)
LADGTADVKGGDGRYIVMGVSGCGKSTIGAALARRLDLDFVDGDMLHPAANIQKMTRQQALDDTDRAPWLDRVAGRLSPGTIIACSALKRAYRDRIRGSRHLYLSVRNGGYADQPDERPQRAFHAARAACQSARHTRRAIRG